MGLFGAMTASVASLSAQGQAISVISDNLANTNTVGYKASRSLFSQLVTSSGVSGTSYNAGGVSMLTQRDQGAQGSMTSTSNATDIAITGNGYFRVADSKTLTNNTAYYYTRAGAFSENKEGYLVTNNGYYLQGWRTDSDGNITNVQDLVNIELQSVGVSARPTTEVRIGANLDGDAEAVSDLYDSTSLTNSLDAILASSDENIYLTDVRMYDSQGGARDVTIAFSKRGENVWDWQLYGDGSDIEGGTAGTETRIANGTLEFNTNGTLKNVTGNTVTINWSGGVTPSTVTLDMGEQTGGKTVTGGAGLAYADGVLAMTAENTAMPTGNYQVRVTGVVGTTATLELVDGAGNPLSPAVTTTMDTGANNREVTFNNGNYKLRLTVTDTFDADPNPGTYPTTIGSLTVGTALAVGAGAGTDGIQQLKSSFNTAFTNQDGFGAGLLNSIAIGEDGYVSGTFTNGETKKLYKIALAVFQNQEGLEAVSGSLLRATDSSGDALIKEAGNGGAGRLVGGSLEASTTDIANEFSNMIVVQRSFQANSTVIQTVDQMLNNLLQIR